MMRGTPTYTQHSVAFPTVPRDDRVIDEVNVSFDAKDGGTFGEFRFVWVDLGDRYPNGALKVSCFSDAYSALLDERVIEVLERVSRARRRRHYRDQFGRRKYGEFDVTPARLIEFLEAEGFVPSTYHQKGAEAA